MDKSHFPHFWLIALFVCLINISYAHGTFFKYTNITCESKDKNFCSVDYCYIKQVSRQKNYMSLRFMLFTPVHNDVFYHLRFMIKRNGWKPFLYSIDIDMCRFYKLRYNGLAKMIFGFLDGYTNMNHTCPYTKEKYVFIDNVTNTDISKKLRGLPLAKGHYALYTKWSYKNVTRAETNIYIEVLGD